LATIFLNWGKTTKRPHTRLVWITDNGAEVGRVKGAKVHQGVTVAPGYVKGDQVVAHAQMCDDRSPPSQTQTAQQAGQVTQYRCLYRTARLLYSATLVTAP